MFSLLAGATAKAGRGVSQPNKHCRVVDDKLRRANQASAFSARLGCNNALLLAYLEVLLQDLSYTAASGEIPKIPRVVDMLIWETSAQARALGLSLATMMQTQHQVWLPQSNL